MADKCFSPAKTGPKSPLGTAKIPKTSTWAKPEMKGPSAPIKRSGKVGK